MANPCGGLTQTIESGAICNAGYRVGAYLFETKPAAITEENAALEATWEALSLLALTNRLHHVKFDITEPGEDSPVEVALNEEKVIVDVERGSDTYKIVTSLTGMKSIYKQLKGGKELYAIFYTSKGYLEGKEVTANTIEAVKYRITATESKTAPKGLGFVNMHFTPTESYEEYKTLIDPEFDPKTISTVKSMTFTATDDNLTSLTISVKASNKVGITDLNVTGAGNFSLTNTATSAAIVITSIVRTGYSYVLNFAVQIEGTAYSLDYEAPETSSEYYELLTAITGTLTA